MTLKDLHILPLACTVLCCGMAVSHAAETARGLYFAGYMGLNVPRESANANFAGGFSGALGFRLSPHWRMEGEIAAKRETPERVAYTADDAGPLKEEFESWSGLANVYYDFETHKSGFQPFVSAGAGFASHTVTATDEGGFAWQLGGGLNYRFNPTLSFSSAYRYLDTANTSIASQDSADHELRFGFDYKIPVQRAIKPRD
ncbi:MAG: porin family protein [Alphaproteobacteria bacterium]|nr:porin family protein [Alphaproteobacteria bacterium]